MHVDYTVDARTPLYLQPSLGACASATAFK